MSDRLARARLFINSVRTSHENNANIGFGARTFQTTLKIYKENPMYKRLLAWMFVSLIVHTIVAVQPASASSRSEKQAYFTEKVRLGVLSLGTGEGAQVEVKLRNKTKLAGYISETTDTNFVVKDAKTGASVPVAFGDVSKIKGHNLSTGAKIGIGIAIGFAVTALIIFLAVRG
jgi:hypothetical protein